MSDPGGVGGDAVGDAFTRGAEHSDQDREPEAATELLHRLEHSGRGTGVPRADGVPDVADGEQDDEDSDRHVHEHHPAPAGERGAHSAHDQPAS
ncbi:hypothetical protein [Amycolatopsis ultiminotia]